MQLFNGQRMKIECSFLIGKSGPYWRSAAQRDRVSIHVQIYLNTAITFILSVTYAVIIRRSAV